jgi:hypothetical protein
VVTENYRLMNTPPITVERLEVRANWTARRVSLLEFAQRVAELVRRLRLVNPALKDWAFLTNEEPWFAEWDTEAASLLSLLIGTDFSESKADRDLGKAKPDKLFNASTFRAHLACTSAGGVATDTPEQGGLLLDVSSGSTPLLKAGTKLWTPQNWIEAERIRTRSRAGVSLRLPADHFGPMHDPAMVLGLLDALVSTWQPARCSVDSFEFLKQAYGMKPFVREQRATGGKRKLWQGWMTYFRLPGLNACLADADVDIDPMGGDGCLVFTERKRADSMQPVHIATAQHIDTLLSGLCINQDEVLVDGWPLDPAGIRYAQQCGAARGGTPLRVGLAEFTARDDRREALIFSSLLRGEALEDLLYAPQSFHQSIDGMRPVAEARRQLRSLTLAGSSDVIEWHIGRDELVAPLRTLLHHHAGIDEARLRVVSTPYLA